MKAMRLLLGILIGFTILSCSSDDENPQEETIIAYKKASRYVNGSLNGTQEVFYNSDKKVEKVVTTIIGFGEKKTTTLDAIYNGNTITKIIETIDFESSDQVFPGIEYDVIINDGQIILRKIDGGEFQIEFTGQYVDSFKLPRTTTAGHFFQRNSDNNIVSHTISKLGVTFNYSDYVTGNFMPFRNIMPQYRDFSNDYLILFGLKVSKKLPLTETIHIGEGYWQTYSIDPSQFTYDNNNNIIKYGDVSDYVYMEFEYIKL